MTQVVIGDIHGKTIWRDIISRHRDADRIIILGDYFDTFDPVTPLEQLQNFYDICEFKRKSDKEIILLIGNHDFHYWPGINESYSGYQPIMRASFEFALRENRDLLQVAFVDENDTVYSHAGITETWLNDVGINVPDIGVLVDRINELFTYRPHMFCFYNNDRSGYGDNVHQSPIWVRPNSLYMDRIGQLQVVGHTRQNNGINPLKGQRQGFYCIDALDMKKPQYLSITDGVITVEVHRDYQR